MAIYKPYYSQQQPSGSTSLLPDEKANISMVARLQNSGFPTPAPQKPSLFMRGLDLISRPNYASAAMARAMLTGKDLTEILSEGKKGLSGKKKITYSDVLRKDFGMKKGVGRTMAGFALDVVLDPTTYLTFGTGGVLGTGAKQIGKAGAKRALTKTGKKALEETTEIAAKRIARRATGRASAETIQNAASRMAEMGLLDKFGTKAQIGKRLAQQGLKGADLAEETARLFRQGQRLFDPGGIGLMIPFTGIKKTVVPAKQVSRALQSIVGPARKMPVVGSGINLGEGVARWGSDLVRTAFVPGHKFTKQLDELTAVQKAWAKQAKLTDKEALNVIPALGEDVQSQLKSIVKSKRWAAESAMEQMKDIFKAFNPEEGRILGEALEDIPGAYQKLSPNAKNTHAAIKVLRETVGNEALEMGFIKRLVKNFNPRFITEEAQMYLKENVGESNPAIRGLIQIFKPKKGKERILMSEAVQDGLIEMAKTPAKKRQLAKKFSSTFFGKKLKQNSVKEINAITMEKLGFNWFIEDAPTAFTKYYVDFATNKSLYDGLENLPRMVNQESGYEIFKPMRKPPIVPKGWEALGRQAMDNPTQRVFMDNFTRTEKGALTRSLKSVGYKNLKDFHKQMTHYLKPSGLDEVLPGYKRFEIDALKGIQAPKFIADQIEQTYQVLTSPKEIDRFLRGYDKTLSWWKRWITIPWMAFHSQNLIGGQFANFQYGLIPMTPKWLKRSNQSRKIMMGGGQELSGKIAGMVDLSEKIGEGKVANMTLREMFENYRRSGAAGGFYKGDLGDSIYRKVFKQKDPLSLAPATKTVRDRLGRKLEHVTEIGAGAGSAVEDLNRLPIFIEEMVEHGDPERAAKAVHKYQFDYNPEAYTSFEREIMQRMIPFYKFMRGNIPMQLDTLYRKTGQTQAVIKAVRDMGGGEDPDKPEWMQNKFAIKLPSNVAKFFGKRPGDKVFMTLPFPIIEMSRINPEDMFSSLTPFLKVPTEMIFNKQLFFGNNIWNPNLPAYAQTSKAYPILKPLTMLPGIGDDLAKLMKWREKPVLDPITQEPTGQVYYEADSKMIYLLKNLPLGPLSRAYSQVGSIGDKQTAEWASELTLPFSIQSVNPTEARMWRLKNSRSELAELIGYLRRRKLIDEAPEEPSPVTEPRYQEYLQQVGVPGY